MLLQARFDSFCRVGRSHEFVFPQSQHNPPAVSQNAIHFSVSAFVALQFDQPIMPIAAWLASVLGAAMPEAAVHEQGEALLGKNEVRLAWQRAVPAPAFDSMGAKD